MPKVSTSQYGELTESEFELEQPTSTHLRRRATVIAAAAVIAAGSVHGGMTVYHYLRPAATQRVTPSDTSTRTESSKSVVPEEVSSSCDAGSTSPMQAFNESEASAWVCRSNGTDAVLTMILDPGKSISSISITPGLQYVSDNGKVTGLQYRVPSKVIWNLRGRIARDGDVSVKLVQDNLTANIWNTLQLKQSMIDVRVTLTVLETKSPAGFNLPDDAPFAVQQIYLWR